MKPIKTFLRVLTLFCTVLIILTGTKQLESVMESCFDKFVQSEMEFENSPEDSLEEEDIELKTLFYSRGTIYKTIGERGLFSLFGRDQALVHGDFSLDFFPPPDLM